MTSVSQETGEVYREEGERVNQRSAEVRWTFTPSEVKSSATEQPGCEIK